MSKIGKIKIRNMADLREVIKTAVGTKTEKTPIDLISVDDEIPTKTADQRIDTSTKKKNRPGRTTTTITESAKKKSNHDLITKNKTTGKKIGRKDQLSNQKRIDNFFKSASKPYKIERPKTIEKENLSKYNSDGKATISQDAPPTTKDTKARKRRKRLFDDTPESKQNGQSDSDCCVVSPVVPELQLKTPKILAKSTMVSSTNELVSKPTIDLCSESETDQTSLQKMVQSNLPRCTQSPKKTPPSGSSHPLSSGRKKDKKSSSNRVLLRKDGRTSASPPQYSNTDKDDFRKAADLIMKTDKATKKIALEDKGHPLVDLTINATETVTLSRKPPRHPGTDQSETPSPRLATKFTLNIGSPTASIQQSESLSPTPTTSSVKSTRLRPCPPYKIVDGTTFAVDAFRYGKIENVTHYFLSHFHADHYVGLTRKFSMPLYMSAITARLVRVFIPIEEQHINELILNEAKVIDGVEVTAIDANHCPGAVMFVFKLTTGRCILHTGDFRATPDMESEVLFWNNDIDTIYLDTTYLESRYSFCTQCQSIDLAREHIQNFQAKNEDKRILYVCGTYLVGKERFWTALAKEFQFKVYAERNRKRVLDTIKLPELKGLLCDNPLDANLHIIPMGNLNYKVLVQYFDVYSNRFDCILAFRPSGWEKNSRPQYRDKINIIGVEYSEHSSFDELRRFVMYLKPRCVFGTVPLGGDSSNTPEIPPKWYKYDKLSGKKRHFQPSITSFIKLLPRDSSQSRELKSLKRSSNQFPSRMALTPSGSACSSKTMSSPISGDVLDEASKNNRPV